MGAASVTGISGPGMSYGLYKPESNAGCCGRGVPPNEPKKKKTVCSTVYNVGTRASYTTGSSSGITVCN